MSEVKISIRVRYSETDKMGVVYHSNYLVWFEVARTELFREAGIPYAQLEEQGYILPAVHAELSYLASAYYDEEIEVFCWIKELKHVSMELGYRAVRIADKRLVTEGTTRLAVLTRDHKIVAMPEHWRSALTKYIQS